MKFYGANDVVELRPIRRYNPSTGWQVTRRYRALRGSFEVAAQAEASAGRAVTVEPDGPKESHDILSVGGVTADGSTPTEILTDNWALLGNMLQKGIWECPLIMAELAKIAGAGAVKKRAEIRTKASLVARGDDKWIKSDGTIVDINEETFLKGVEDSGLSRTVFAQLLLDMSRGVETYQVSQYVLKHQYVFMAGALVKDPYLYANKLMTTAVLKLVEAFPTTLPFDLPDGVWLKQTPTIQPLGGNKWQIEEEWWHADDYARSLYTLITG